MQNAQAYAHMNPHTFTRSDKLLSAYTDWGKIKALLMPRRCIAQIEDKEYTHIAAKGLHQVTAQRQMNLRLW